MIDGTGTAGWRADVGIRDDTIVAVGIEHVLVNGRFVVRDGEHSGSLPGRVLTPG